MTSSTATLLDFYGQATPSIRRRGRQWYPEANRRLRKIAKENNCALAQAAAVFSILSQAAQLETTLRWTDQIFKGQARGGRFPNVQEPKIKAVLETRRPHSRVKGPKVHPFYRAIMGDTNALVLDRWAFFAAGMPRHTKHVPPAVRLELDNAYRHAAELAGETVRAFQAIVWLVVRESTPKSNGILPRLSDITA